MNDPKLDAIRKELEKLNSEQKLELALMLIHGDQGSPYKARKVDLSKHAGKAHLPVDGLLWQSSIRAEWDR